jgi:hypothetical protein
MMLRWLNSPVRVARYQVILLACGSGLYVLAFVGALLARGTGQ